MNIMRELCWIADKNIMINLLSFPNRVPDIYTHWFFVPGETVDFSIKACLKRDIN